MDELGLPYAVGESLSSSVLVVAFSEDFYIDADAVAEAVRRRSSFNVIHLGTMMKADLFVAGSTLLDKEQLRRRRLITIRRDPPRQAFVTAPENIILRKLDWFRQGGGISDQQWRDVLGGLKAQRPTIELDHLRETAASVGLDELLARALSDAGIAQP